MIGAYVRPLKHAAILLGFGALSVAMTWPLASRAATHVVRAKWYYDSMVNIHILGSRVHYALGMSSSLKSAYDNYFCAPTPFSIANNENHFGLALLYAPLLLATKDPLLSYNLLLLFCLSLSGFFTYVLVRELSGNALAGVLAGVGFAYCPYVFFELGRVQLVATQWIPLFALFLHRAAATGSMGSMIGVALTFAMQVGTCLYYAMFLLVYALFVGGWLFIRERRLNRSFALKLAVAALVAGIPMAGMVYPYFQARQDFPLTRSELLSARYSGKLEHLAKVYPENKALASLRDPAPGPHEPIAFPGYTLLLLAAVALTVPTVTALLRLSGTRRKKYVLGVLLTPYGLGLAVLASLLLHSFVVGACVFAVILLLWSRLAGERLLPPLILIYSAFLLLSLVLFLGPVPFNFGGEPVQGLYYYLHRFVPGFDGIRYVSRLAILGMIALAILGGFGASLLLRGRTAVRVSIFVLLLFSMLYELRNAPMTLVRLPSRRDLPPAYKWLAKHRGPEPIATMPAYPLGYFGARNDYLALFHRRRTIDGKSSWMPPVTYAYIFEARRFPRRTGVRLLQALGAKYLVLHTEEMPERAGRVLAWLDRRPDTFKRRFSAGTQYVYEIMPPPDGSGTLLGTPKLPPNAVRVAGPQIYGRSSSNPATIHYALDNDPITKWFTLRFQQPGDWFEIGLRKERKVVALEFSQFDEAFEAPAAFALLAADANGNYKTLMTRPEIRFYRDQVYHPKSFVFRLVLDTPVSTKALRVELTDGVAGRRWAIHELAVWATR